MRRIKEKKKLRTFWAIIISTVLGMLIGLLVLFLFSAVSVYMNFGSWEIKPASIVAILISGYVSGFICGKLRRRNGLAIGCFCGIIISSICFIVNTLAVGNNFSVYSIVKIFLIILASVIGGTVGVNSREKYF